MRLFFVISLLMLGVLGKTNVYAKDDMAPLMRHFSAMRSTVARKSCRSRLCLT